MRDLSILIPARNEMFLNKTIEDILSHIEADTEVIAVLDGQWAPEPIPDHDRVTIIHYAESVGQRAATNQACRLSSAKYIMKVDAHCAFDQGFDRKMLADMNDNWTMVPTMRNLHAFDWVCPDGHRRYQGPSGPCQTCGKETVRDVVWIPKPSPQSVSYCFDSEPHFQYFGDFPKRPEGQGEITPSMSLQGSCFMMTRDKYWELNICDESFGSWGSQGIEVAVKTWLSGGQVMVNRKTWYAHMFRTQGGDFSFPYQISGKQVSRAKHTARDLFFNNKWDKQIHPLSWLVEKFWPVPGWTPDDLARLKGEPTKGIIFYTDNQLMLKIAHRVQGQLKSIGIPIVSASLKPMPHFGEKNIHVPLPRGYLAYFTQIVKALEASTADIIYMCEHDVLYHPSHFKFIPPTKDKFYYNENFWKLRIEDGHALHYDAKQVSGLCAYRELLLDEYRKRLAVVEKNGYTRSTGFEPGTHDGRAERYWSEFPNVDIRHKNNLTRNRWSQDQFRDKSTCTNWIEAEEIPGWGKGSEIV